LDFGDEIGGVEVDDFFRKNGSIIIDGVKLETVLEGFDVELLQEGSF